MRDNKNGGGGGFDQCHFGPVVMAKKLGKSDDKGFQHLKFQTLLYISSVGHVVVPQRHLNYWACLKNRLLTVHHR